MEKKLGLFFTTIVTHITALSIFSNPNINIQTGPYVPFLFLSLKYTVLCIYLLTDPLSLALNYISRSLFFISPPPSFGCFFSDFRIASFAETQCTTRFAYFSQSEHLISVCCC